MADFTNPNDIPTAPRDPVTSEFGTAALDNPIGIAQGVEGAPKISDKVLSAAGNTTITELSTYGGLFIRGGSTVTAQGSAVATSVSVQHSDDGGVTFSEITSLYFFSVIGVDPGNVLNTIFEVFIDFASGEFRGYGLTSGVGRSSSHISGAVAGLSNDVTDLRVIGLDALLINPQGGDSAT